ncbi:unnamed protein product [Zymoseptoria tritici ST99CH_1A5]|uniref:Uncharacterized protein n=1 Tax=Zymoseptoria tritici ST99CH_1A5 TaxID=1276529 RepID=A0A1Y6M0S1_ZYMTR|nr:unnamed protein product [Zymoseptoria tritici ST99CH_3D1]SMY29300.1 unnamed protein product [Zymoseptoria tritici ST99CH_1A5]
MPLSLGPGSHNIQHDDEEDGGVAIRWVEEPGVALCEARGRSPSTLSLDERDYAAKLEEVGLKDRSDMGMVAFALEVKDPTDRRRGPGGIGGCDLLYLRIVNPHQASVYSISQIPYPRPEANNDNSVIVSPSRVLRCSEAGSPNRIGIFLGDGPASMLDRRPIFLILDFECYSSGSVWSRRLTAA